MNMTRTLNRLRALEDDDPAIRDAIPIFERLMTLLPADDDMACCRCGHIQPHDVPFEWEPDREDGDEDSESPICPACGNCEIQGNECFATWEQWPQDTKEAILDMRAMPRHESESE